MSKVLNADIREDLNKGANGRLRKLGRIPAVIYGHQEPLAISIDQREFNNNFKRISESEIINIKLAKAERKVLIKDYQRDHLKGQVLHLDFYEIETGHKVRTRVPLRIAGTAPGLRDGGILENAVHELEIECLAEFLPEFIEVDVSALAIGHAIHIRDLPIGEGVRVINNADQVVASITHAKEIIEAVVEAPVAEAAAPAGSAVSAPGAAPAAAPSKKE